MESSSSSMTFLLAKNHNRVHAREFSPFMYRHRVNCISNLCYEGVFHKALIKRPDAYEKEPSTVLQEMITKETMKVLEVLQKNGKGRVRTMELLYAF